MMKTPDANHRSQPRRLCGVDFQISAEESLAWSIEYLASHAMFAALDVPVAQSFVVERCGRTQVHPHVGLQLE